MSKSFSSPLCPSCADSPQNKSKRPEPGLSSFNLRETNFLHHKWESLDTTQLFTSMENPSQESMTAALLLYMPLDPTLSLPGLKIDNQQATPWVEHASNFGESLTLEFIRQMVHHQTTENHVERVVRKGELLNQTDLEIDRKVAPCCFAASNGDHLRRCINAVYLSRFANALPGKPGQRSGATPNI